MGHSVSQCTKPSQLENFNRIGKPIPHKEADASVAEPSSTWSLGTTDGCKSATNNAARRLSFVESECAAASSIRTGVPLYPMWLMTATDIVGLDERLPILPHQSYMARGLMTLFEAGMRVLFCSHEWLSWAHPDPDSVQLKTLQKVLQRLMRGEMSVHSHWGTYFSYPDHVRAISANEWLEIVPELFIWLDYFSIPQPAGSCGPWDPALPQDTLAAINSIPPTHLMNV